VSVRLFLCQPQLALTAKNTDTAPVRFYLKIISDFLRLREAEPITNTTYMPIIFHIPAAVSGDVKFAKTEY
jgi:hypothetical protein